LVVKNYTGDRINFTIAAEQARSEGIPVEMVFVADDCAIPKSKGVTGRRGIAGTCFVHKVAGAAAEAGLSLKAVKEEALQAAQCVASIGVSSTVCHIPGRRKSSRIPEGMIEMGLGIHGEPGAETIAKRPVTRVVGDMLKIITDESKDRGYMSLGGGDSVALLMNNLGSATALEISVATRDAIRRLEEKGVRVERVVAGPLMTSMDMAGFSISLLKLPSAKSERERMLYRLDSDTNAPGWPRGGGERPMWGKLVRLEQEDPCLFQRPAQLSHTGRKMENVLHGVAQSLKEAEESLTEWDLKVGDGDCGATFKRGAEAALADMDGYPLNSIPDTLESIAKSVARSMGGTSGALYQIFLLSLCATTRQQEKKEGADSSSSLSHLAFAFDEAISKIASSGGATEGDRTMLDALIPASRSLQQSSQLERELLPALELAVLAAECGAEATKEMDARAGRSNYVPEAVLRQTPDPGAKAAAIWMRAALEAYKKSSS